MNALPLWLDAIIAALLVVGAAFALVGAYGLAKLGDFMKRLHGPTKATTLGVGCVLLASLLWFLGTPGTPHGREILIAAFLFVTAPVSGHLLVVAAMRMDQAARPAPTEGRSSTRSVPARDET
ncbi:MAG: Na+/H+ antiporter subunit G [Xanthomonadaceae bacterium]|jgi:multicomponent K+:H+ antiporter subunit G|nr:Na+/H+ antiporter subunit G [Xanthomonadaceae bacterium]